MRRCHHAAARLADLVRPPRPSPDLGCSQQATRLTSAGRPGQTLPGAEARYISARVEWPGSQCSRRRWASAASAARRRIRASTACTPSDGRRPGSARARRSAAGPRPPGRRAAASTQRGSSPPAAPAPEQERGVGNGEDQPVGIGSESGRRVRAQLAHRNSAAGIERRERAGELLLQHADDDLDAPVTIGLTMTPTSRWPKACSESGTAQDLVRAVTDRSAGRRREERVPGRALGPERDRAAEPSRRRDGGVLVDDPMLRPASHRTSRGVRHGRVSGSAAVGRDPGEKIGDQFYGPVRAQAVESGTVPGVIAASGRTRGVDECARDDSE